MSFLSFQNHTNLLISAEEIAPKLGGLDSNQYSFNCTFSYKFAIKSRSEFPNRETNLYANDNTAERNMNIVGRGYMYLLTYSMAHSPS